MFIMNTKKTKQICYTVQGWKKNSVNTHGITVWCEADRAGAGTSTRRNGAMRARRVRRHAAVTTGWEQQLVLFRPSAHLMMAFVAIIRQSEDDSVLWVQQPNMQIYFLYRKNLSWEELEESRVAVFFFLSSINSSQYIGTRSMASTRIPD